MLHEITRWQVDDKLFVLYAVAGQFLMIIKRDLTTGKETEEIFKKIT